MKKLVGALIFLLGSQFLVPSAAIAAQNPSPSAGNQNQTIAGLIVKYKHGVRPVDSLGQPTGDAQLGKWDFKSTRALGFGYRSVKLDAPLPLAEAKAAAEALEALPSVEYASVDYVATLADVVAPNGQAQTQTSQTPLSWGLDRIDQTSLPLNNEYNYTYDGTGVTAYVVDTGINARHKEFTNRILPGYSAITNSSNVNDCQGHGTHVSGTIGGTTYGVAKKVNIVPVQIFGCGDVGGEYSQIIDAINWIINNHPTGAPAVANMSIGGPYDAALNDAVTSLVGDGVTVAVASGNDSADACDYSPASALGSITVNASAIDDTNAWFSNYGSCTDIYAPGEGITSAWIGNSNATNTIDGTSMATPHVAGAAARILSEFPNSTPAQVWTKLSAQATAVNFIPGNSQDAKRLLHLDAPPSAISNLAANAGDGSVSLTWSAPTQNGGKPVNGYLVQVFNSKKASLPNSTVNVTGGSSTSATISGLTNGTAYYFNVIATNIVGSGLVASVKVTATPAQNYSLSPTPTISGTLGVSLTLTANTGTWSPAPKFTYQWLRNGSPISRATRATYKVVSADVGSRLSVSVTATLRNFQTKTLTSAETSTVN